MPKIAESDVIEGVYVVELDVHGDERGQFVQTYRRSWFPEGREMVQANFTSRRAGCVVGLHYHLHQADYWTVPSGIVRIVLHDLREGSPTDGGTVVMQVAADDNRGVFIPPGVAHGFAALTAVNVAYLVENYYNPADELGVAWDDPDIAAEWGVTDPILSERDRTNPRRADLPAGRRPYAGLRT